MGGHLVYPSLHNLYLPPVRVSVWATLVQPKLANHSVSGVVTLPVVQAAGASVLGDRLGGVAQQDESMYGVLQDWRELKLEREV
jgi:hypothetical protein